MATFSYTLPVVSGSENTWGATLNANWTALGTFFGSLDSSELAILDGALISTAELNLLQGMTPQLDGLTATAAELNILDGATITTAQLNAISGLSATAAEINIMDGDTAATATTLVDADRVVANDAGTMKQVAMSDVRAYTDQSVIGVGQTWQGVLASRALGTTYQNTTGKPIMVNVTLACASTADFGGEVFVSADNVTFISVAEISPDGELHTMSVIVPDSHYYKVSAQTPAVANLFRWRELR